MASETTQTARGGSGGTGDSGGTCLSDAATAAAAAYEHTHVHAVYEAIADHFSATRYAPWPLVARFLAAQPPGSIGLDVGCGNGKYLAAAGGHFVLACDRSEALVGVAHKRWGGAAATGASSGAPSSAAATGAPPAAASLLLADSLDLPYRAACADFVICIAVVHHLSTRARRQEAVAELLRCLRPPDGDGSDKDRRDAEDAAITDKDRRDAEDDAANKDRKDAEDDAASTENAAPRGRLLIYVWALEQASSRRGWTAGGEQDLLVPWVKRRAQAKQKEQQQQQPKEQTFQRYYHLYREGELQEDVVAAGGRVVASGYEKDNWWVTAELL